MLSILKEERIKELDRLEINIVSYVYKFYKVDDQESSIVRFKALLDKLRNTEINNMRDLIEF